MKRTKQATETLQTGFSRNHAQKKLLPSDLRIYRQSVKTDLPYIQYEGVKMLFAEEGRGRLFINGREHPFERGDSCVLFLYHFHRLSGAMEAPLKVVSIELSHSAYLYIANAPCCQLTNIGTIHQMPFARFEELPFNRCMEIIEELKLMAGDISFAYKMALLIELFGRLYRQATGGA